MARGDRLEDYWYDLPEARIAQQPADRRESSRLMVVDRRTGDIRDSVFAALPDWLPPNGLLVVNDARVTPVRLIGRRDTGGAVEIFILDPPAADAGPGVYELECLTRPSRRLTPCVTVDFGETIRAEVIERRAEGRRLVRFFFDEPPVTALERVGRMPLPPYIKRPATGLGEADMDRERYQTVYARRPGAVAAPTAGLHFTRELIARLEERGTAVKTLNLRVGFGTFAPVREREIARHRIHAEQVSIPADTAETVNRCKRESRPVTAVGTTVVRSLEAAGREDAVTAHDGLVDIFIHPGFEFKVVDHLVTNFHLPESTLLMLAAAFAGLDLILEAYRRAVRDGYRFFSYGDAMLIL